MHLSIIQKWTLSVALGLAMVSVIAIPAPAAAPQEVKTEDLDRKPKVKVAPFYPEVARRMNIAGTVRLAVVVAPNGTVKSSKPVGGHPLLVNAAMDAIKRWKFEAAPTESSGIVEFKFQPQN